MPSFLVKVLLATALLAVMSGAYAQAVEQKPNILVLWGDDIGQSNISTYTRGMVGYKTPNIDRIASEGMTFTDYYAEQSCAVRLAEESDQPVTQVARNRGFECLPKSC